MSRQGYAPQAQTEAFRDTLAARSQSGDQAENGLSLQASAARAHGQYQDS